MYQRPHAKRMICDRAALNESESRIWSGVSSEDEEEGGPEKPNEIKWDEY
jgi:hypothetical protein